MVKLTESLRKYLWKFHREDVPLIMFGHVELLNKHWDDYIEWCGTDEGKQYLEGGALYKEPR